MDKRTKKTKDKKMTKKVDCGGKSGTKCKIYKLKKLPTKSKDRQKKPAKTPQKSESEKMKNSKK